jgi:hypothetical protein
VVCGLQLVRSTRFVSRLGHAMSSIFCFCLLSTVNNHINSLTIIKKRRMIYILVANERFCCYTNPPSVTFDYSTKMRTILIENDVHLKSTRIMRSSLNQV